MKALDYVMRRLKEPTTWRGLILVLTALGLRVSPEMAEGIISIGLGAAGAIGVIAPDPKKPIGQLTKDPVKLKGKEL